MLCDFRLGQKMPHGLCYGPWAIPPQKLAAMLQEAKAVWRTQACGCSHTHPLTHSCIHTQAFIFPLNLTLNFKLKQTAQMIGRLKQKESNTQDCFPPQNILKANLNLARTFSTSASACSPHRGQKAPVRMSHTVSPSSSKPSSGFTSQD